MDGGIKNGSRSSHYLLGLAYADGALHTGGSGYQVSPILQFAVPSPTRARHFLGRHEALVFLRLRYPVDLRVYLLLAQLEPHDQLILSCLDCLGVSLQGFVLLHNLADVLLSFQLYGLH